MVAVNVICLVNFNTAVFFMLMTLYVVVTYSKYHATYAENLRWFYY